jgi:uncharacterized protein (TIGR00369 family)
LPSHYAEITAKLQRLIEGMSPHEPKEALDVLERRRQAPLSPHGFLFHMLGLRWRLVERGHMCCELPIRESLYNPNNTLHGGIILTLVDYAMASAVISRLDLSKGDLLMTIELKINYLAAVADGIVTAEAKIRARARALSCSNRRFPLTTKVSSPWPPARTLSRAKWIEVRQGAPVSHSLPFGDGNGS